MRPGGGAGGIWGDEPPQDHTPHEPTPIPAAPPAGTAATDEAEEDGEPARKKAKREREGEDAEAREEKDGASGAESEDDGPPVEASSRVPVPGLFPEGAVAEGPVPASGPSIPPSRLAAQGEEAVDVDAEADAGRSKSSSTIICRYFKSGKCHQGDQCPFLHTVSTGSSRLLTLSVR